jgi:hypothetical protein
VKGRARDFALLRFATFVLRRDVAIFADNKKTRFHFQEAGFWFKVIICFQPIAFSLLDY